MSSYWRGRDFETIASAFEDAGISLDADPGVEFDDKAIVNAIKRLAEARDSGVAARLRLTRYLERVEYLLTCMTKDYEKYKAKYLELKEIVNGSEEKGSNGGKNGTNA